MKYLEILKIVLAMVPAIIEIIKALELAIPGSGQGKAKLEALKSVLQSAYSGANDAIVKFDELWPQIMTIANGLVSAFNALGVFKKEAVKV